MLSKYIIPINHSNQKTIKYNEKCYNIEYSQISNDGGELNNCLFISILDGIFDKQIPIKHKYIIDTPIKMRETNYEECIQLIRKDCLDYVEYLLRDGKHQVINSDIDNAVQSDSIPAMSILGQLYELYSDPIHCYKYNTQLATHLFNYVLPEILNIKIACIYNSDILGISSPKNTFCFNENNPIILIGGDGHFEYVNYFKQI